MILTPEKHQWLLRRGAAIASIAAILLLLAFAFQTCGNPLNPLNMS